MLAMPTIILTVRGIPFPPCNKGSSINIFHVMVYAIFIKAYLSARDNTIQRLRGIPCISLTLIQSPATTFGFPST